MRHSAASAPSPLPSPLYSIDALSLSLSIYLSFSLSLSLSLSTPYSLPSSSLPTNGGFSARTRRRGSIIHHTNSPEAGERTERQERASERTSGLADRRLGGESSTRFCYGAPARASRRQRGNAHAAHTTGTHHPFK